MAVEGVVAVVRVVAAAVAVTAAGVALLALRFIDARYVFHSEDSPVSCNVGTGISTST